MKHVNKTCNVLPLKEFNSVCRIDTMCKTWIVSATVVALISLNIVW